jgi:hypothetical protein
MKEIFDFIKTKNMIEYWINKNINKKPYLGEALFPSVKEIGVRLDWLKGSTGLPVVLKLSAWDSKVTKRDREGFEVLSTKMPFFKEAMAVDEELMQKLRELMQANNEARIDNILSKVFDDQVKLIDAAYERVEAMRMQALTTGTVVVTGNGAKYTYDFQMPQENKKTVLTSWSDPTADIIKDIDDIKLAMKAKGVTLRYLIVNSNVVRYFMQNTKIKNAIYVMANGNVDVTSARAISFIATETGINIIEQDNVYANEDGTTTPYFADDIAVFIPEGPLGQTHYGVTPEEDKAQSGSSKLDVAMVNDQVAVTTWETEDPVATMNKVSMVALPSFDRADEVVILDITAA